MPASKHHLRARRRRRPGTRLPTPAPFQRLEVREPSTGARVPYRARHQLLKAPIPPRPVASQQGPSESSPPARTHPISHGWVTFRSLNTGLVRKQTAQLVMTESISVRRRLLLLLPAILPVSGGNAGSWQPPPPPGLHLSGPALPVVASPGRLKRLCRQKTTIPKVDCAPWLASCPSGGGRSTYESVVHDGKCSLH